LARTANELFLLFIDWPKDKGSSSSFTNQSSHHISQFLLHIHDCVYLSIIGLRP
jgi:hypothetical protein